MGNCQSTDWEALKLRKSQLGCRYVRAENLSRKEGASFREPPLDGAAISGGNIFNRESCNWGEMPTYSFQSSGYITMHGSWNGFDGKSVNKSAFFINWLLVNNINERTKRIVNSNFYKVYSSLQRTITLLSYSCFQSWKKITSYKITVSILEAHSFPRKAGKTACGRQQIKLTVQLCENESWLFFPRELRSKKSTHKIMWRTITHMTCFAREARYKKAWKKGAAHSSTERHWFLVVYESLDNLDSKICFFPS